MRNDILLQMHSTAAIIFRRCKLIFIKKGEGKRIHAAHINFPRPLLGTILCIRTSDEMTNMSNAN